MSSSANSSTTRCSRAPGISTSRLESRAASSARGLVPDHADPDSLARSGTFEPVWVPLAELANVAVGLDARPRALIEQLVASM